MWLNAMKSAATKKEKRQGLLIADNSDDNFYNINPRFLIEKYMLVRYYRVNGFWTPSSKRIV